MSTIDELKNHFEYLDLLKRCCSSIYATIGGANGAEPFERELKNLREYERGLVFGFAEELKQKHSEE